MSVSHGCAGYRPSIFGITRGGAADSRSLYRQSLRHTPARDEERIQPRTGEEEIELVFLGTMTHFRYTVFDLAPLPIASRQPFQYRSSVPRLPVLWVIVISHLAA